MRGFPRTLGIPVLCHMKLLRQLNLSSVNHLITVDRQQRRRNELKGEIHQMQFLLAQLCALFGSNYVVNC